MVRRPSAGDLTFEVLGSAAEQLAEADPACRVSFRCALLLDSGRGVMDSWGCLYRSCDGPTWCARSRSQGNQALEPVFALSVRRPNRPGSLALSVRQPNMRASHFP